jgi:8-oxo-dGTP diphosphatase
MGQLHREFACAVLVDALGRLLLQQRDDVPGILYPGKIGLFGGQLESGESYLQCLVREIAEETSCYFPPERFAYLTSYDFKDDSAGFSAHGELFVARNVPIENVVVTEGTLFIADPREIALLEPRLLPSAKTGLMAFFGRA